MIEKRRPQMGLTRVAIPLGNGSAALTRHTKLHALLILGKQRLRAIGNPDDARAVYMWQLTSRYRIVEAPHWTLELNGEEWQALSRALRCIGREGRSMLAWLSIRKVDTHGEP